MNATKNNMLTDQSVETLLKAFRIFNKCGLIKEDLQFDPEHYIRTVVIPGWNSILENKENNHTMQNCKFAKKVLSSCCLLNT